MKFNLKTKFIIAISFVFFIVPFLVAAQTTPNGQFCSSSSECQSGYCDTTNEVCANNPGNSSGAGAVCSSQSTCSNGNACVSGTCQPGVLNAPCGSNNNCQPGLMCDSKTNTCLLPQAPSLGTTTLPNAGGDILPANSLPCDTTGHTNNGCPAGLCPVNGICLPPSQYKTGLASSNTLTDLILKIIQGLLVFSGLIAVLFIIIGGYYYMSAGGNQERAEKGRGTITNFVIGLVIIILAYTIVTILISTVTGQDQLLGGSPTSYNLPSTQKNI